MRFVTYQRDGVERAGLLEGEEIRAFRGGLSLLGALQGDGLDHAAAAARRQPDDVAALDDVELRAPIPVPPSIRDFLAFEQHRRNAAGGEVDPDWYELPIFYFSNPAAVHGPSDDVEIAPGSTRWDYELEFAAVVGAEGSDLSAEAAEQHIAGYTILCDFSARDLQAREMRQRLGPAKGKDSATSLGPALVTPDELEPWRAGQAFALEMTASVNGRRYGGGVLSEVYWSFGEMIAYASRGTRVVPGDVIGSGTVGTGCILELDALGRGAEFPWLVEGDVVELSVAEVGVLRHRIVAGRPVVPLRPQA
jgi:2-keto-4-pentenoate hydratase/2-oxohepta-3-ene-1,7-dioic acid hydratase in catechol pathway